MRFNNGYFQATFQALILFAGVLLLAELGRCAAVPRGNGAGRFRLGQRALDRLGL